MLRTVGRAAQLTNLKHGPCATTWMCGVPDNGRNFSRQIACPNTNLNRTHDQLMTLPGLYLNLSFSTTKPQLSCILS